MSTPKEIVRQIEEAWDRDDYETLDRLIATDIVSHDAPPGFPSGLEGAKFGHSVFKRSFPDVKHTIHELTGDGDLVAVRIRAQGTHTGDAFFGVPTTGRQISTESISIYRVKDGQAVEHWGLNDGLAIFMQLGAFPPAPAPA